MAPAPRWGRAAAVEGPQHITLPDVAALNQVFSDAFTERYRRDGMVGVRVPFLNPAIWRYAIDDAGDGAMLWRDERGAIVAFNIAHRSGIEGWMGPLAVRPDAQDGGVGKLIVRTGRDWLERQGARVIGLETMPRTMDNIGFYSGLGFEPGRLTLTVTFSAAVGEHAAMLLGRQGASEKPEWIAACHRLTDAVRPGYDFSRELELTDELALGDTLLFLRDGVLRGFALYHTAPLVEGRVREELRVLKLVLADEADAEPLVRQLADQARRSGTRQVAIRVQGEFVGLYNRLVALGGRVRWTDLRMTTQGHPEPPVVGRGVVLSNWEI
ncbi:MAG TPA: GNAT family N-acetyltransferase [Gemmatimonadaceae bacterium]|nr:GNAT family N-acetyltransferase [Gemmatimonadaceae bacterium]